MGFSKKTIYFHSLWTSRQVARQVSSTMRVLTLCDLLHSLRATLSAAHCGHLTSAKGLVIRFTLQKLKHVGYPWGSNPLDLYNHVPTIYIYITGYKGHMGEGYTPETFHHRGFTPEDHFPVFKKWVICRFHLNLPGCKPKMGAPGTGDSGFVYCNHHV